MRIETLEYFLEVSYSKSFTQAARNLYISQQGLSKAMTGLENELGVSLFRRIRKRVELTEEGKLLAAYVEHVIRATDELNSNLRQLKKSGTDRELLQVPLLGVPYITNQMFEILGDLLDDYDLSGSSMNEVSANTLADLVRCDLGGQVLVVNVPEDRLEELLEVSSCTYVPMLYSKLQVIGSKSLISAKRNSITAEELSTVPFAYYNDYTLSSLMDYIFRNTELEPNVIYHTSNAAAIKAQIRSGRAATFGDSFSTFAGRPSEMLTTCTVLPSVTLCLGFFYSEGEGVEMREGYINRFSDMLHAEFGPYMEKMGGCAKEVPLVS